LHFLEYVGTEVCKNCHLTEYENFKKYSRMSRSFEPIEKMKHKITSEELKAVCSVILQVMAKKGGFVSIEITPHLQHTGCEVCHGPGKNM